MHVTFKRYFDYLFPPPVHTIKNYVMHASFSDIIPSVHTLHTRTAKLLLQATVVSCCGHSDGDKLHGGGLHYTHIHIHTNKCTHTDGTCMATWFHRDRSSAGDHRTSSASLAVENEMLRWDSAHNKWEKNRIYVKTSYSAGIYSLCHYSSS